MKKFYFILAFILVMLIINGCGNNNSKEDLYVVRFESNGGQGSMVSQEFVEDELQALSLNEFTRDGYSFSEWNTVSDGSGKSYEDGQRIRVSSNMTLWAQWEKAQIPGENNQLNGHDYVDLGLPSGTLWATCNIGASSPESYGGYYAWGETSTKSTCWWNNYKYATSSSSDWGNAKVTKYCYNSNYGSNGFTDYISTLQSSDDVATETWGSGWRMPTYNEMCELYNNCSYEKTTLNGTKGLLFTGSNGNSIFLPAAGAVLDNGTESAGVKVYYWTTSLNTDDSRRAGALFYFVGDNDTYNEYLHNGVDKMWGRFCGMSIRPVCSAQK